MAIEKELVTNFDPTLARSDLLETFASIFSNPTPEMALAIHKKLGFVALIHGSVRPYVVDGQEYYTGTHLTIAQYVAPSTGHLTVKAWGNYTEDGSKEYDMRPAAADCEDLDPSSAVYDRTLAHMCGRLEYDAVVSETEVEQLVDYIDLMPST